MDRHGNRIIFTTKEQASFSVPETSSIDAALDTAITFQKVGLRIGTEAEVFPDVETPQEAIDRNARHARATELIGFSKAIFELCPDTAAARELEAMLRQD